MNDEFTHPALYQHMVEQRGAPQAWSIISHGRQTKKSQKRAASRRLRRGIRAHLQHGANLRFNNRVAGNGWEIA
jgi:hypothetical protein